MNKSIKILYFFQLLTCFLLLSTCTNSTKIIPLKEITLNYSSLTIEKGENIQLIVTFSPENATNKDVIWTSSDENVATVSDDGLVIAISEGTAIITATTDDGLFEAICDVFVYVMNTYTFTVNNAEQWIDVVVFIREKGNYNTYTIYIEDDFEMPDDFSFHFPDLIGLIVEIIGNNEKIPKIKQGKMNILSHQVVTIQDIFFIHSNKYPNDYDPFNNHFSVVGDGAVLNMKGNTTITKSSRSGVIVLGGTFNLYDGTIIDNTNTLGGGVLVAARGTFVMSGGLITKNMSFIDYNIFDVLTGAGGGVYVSFSTFIMSGGIISNNVSEIGVGGGVCLSHESTFLMSAGTISNNSEGLSAHEENNTFVMSGGVIHGTHESSATVGLANFNYAIDRRWAPSCVLKYGDSTDILPHIDGYENRTIHTVIGRE